MPVGLGCCIRNLSLRSIASIINTFGMGWAFDYNLATLEGYFIGDISGMFACMFALMLLFKVLRDSEQV